MVLKNTHKQSHKQTDGLSTPSLDCESNYILSDRENLFYETNNQYNMINYHINQLISTSSNMTSKNHYDQDDFELVSLLDDDFLENHIYYDYICNEIQTCEELPIF